MNIFRKYKNLWMAGVIIVIAILFIVNFSTVVGGVQMLWNSLVSLILGAMLAFVLNLIMDPVEKKLKKSDHPFLSKHARGLGILVSLLVVILAIVLILSIIIPNMINAIQVLTKEAPSYFNEIESYLKEIMSKYPLLSNQMDTLNINWKETIEKLLNFIGKGFGFAFDSTINVVTGVISSAVNLFVIVVFAVYVLSEKERFVRLYHFFCSLYLTEKKTCKLTQDLNIINDSFKAFVGGEIIEAAILTTMCTVGMTILQLPYPPMIGVLVGVINMIPMVGAFIGGGIGAFIIFTISPMKCLIFLVFLCIIQQIESNVFFPRIIGNRVGLPGIYVMITIVVGGSLFGVFGMLLGVPIMASVYKIGKNYFVDKAEEKIARQPDSPQAHELQNDLKTLTRTGLSVNCDLVGEEAGAGTAVLSSQDVVPESDDAKEPEKPENDPAATEDNPVLKAGWAIRKGLDKAETSLEKARTKDNDSSQK